MRPSELDLPAIRAQFPILATTMQGKPLVYLDNAATTQKPVAVLDAIRHYYEAQNANIHRGVYTLSQVATEAYEDARRKVQRFLNAAELGEIIFTRGTTESINLVASSWGRAHLKAGDEVIVSHLEHHSNIVPWQIACEAAGARLRVIPINDAGELVMEEYAKLLGPKTRIVSVVHSSNALGTVNDVKTMARMAHAAGAKMMVDGAQWVAHHSTDVRDLDCDFYAFSGHKLYGPTGIGILYGKRALLEAMPPYQGGGDMIHSVTFEKTTYAELPNKFEAGTPDISGAVGLGAAIDYVHLIGLNAMAAHEGQLLAYATEQLSKLNGLRIIGTAREKGAVISFVLENPAMSSQDIGMRLDLEGIAVRTGHHCCQPVMDRFDIAATARASFAVYNTREDVDALAAALRKIIEAARRKGHPTAHVESTNVVYPQPAGESPQAVADELLETFEFLGDWAERYQYIIELGEKLPAMPQAMKTEPNRVHGCQSTVYLSARMKPGADEVIEFLADSDADIVRGLIGILERLFSGQRAGEVSTFDVEGLFAKLGLDQHLSMTRRNGLAGMVKRIRTLAGAMALAGR